MSTMMKCPACNTEFDKLAKLGLCPNYECRAPLKIVEREDENGRMIKSSVYRKQKDVVSSEDKEETYSTVYNRDGVKVERSDKDNYIVTYYKVIKYNWIYCPGCESKMFQNNMIHGSFEHKCHKCKAITTYVFS